jgi:hypothetical protein
VNLVVENKMLVGEFRTSKKVNKIRVGHEVTSPGSHRFKGIRLLNMVSEHFKTRRVVKSDELNVPFS